MLFISIEYVYIFLKIEHAKLAHYYYAPPPNPSMFLTPMTVLLWLSECVVLNLWVLQYQVVEHMTVIFSSVDTRSAGFHH